MNMVDLCSALNKGEQIEITCHPDKEVFRFLFFKVVRTRVVPIRTEFRVGRGELIAKVNGNEWLKLKIEDRLRALREYALRKTNEEGLGTEPKDLI